MDSVCNCPDADHTVEICIGEIKRLNREADGFFKLLAERCEHLGLLGSLCTIPVSKDVPAGILRCTVGNCPLVK